jgi:hypothetical protein
MPFLLDFVFEFNLNIMFLHFLLVKLLVKWKVFEISILKPMLEGVSAFRFVS